MNDNTVTEKHYAASCVVLNEQKTKTLFIFHNKLQKWLIPGGHVDPNESPDEAAVREVKEEVGIDVTLVHAGEHLPQLNNDKEKQIPTPFYVLLEKIPASKKHGEHFHVDYIYLAYTNEGAIEIAEQEISEARWFSKTEVMECDTFDSIKRICDAVMV